VTGSVAHPAVRPQTLAGRLRARSAELFALPPEARVAWLTAFLRASAADALGLPAARIDAERSLTACGLDSLSAVELKGQVEAALGVALPLDDLLSGASLRELAGSLLAGFEAGAAPAEGTAEPAVPGGVDDREAPLSAGQRALWFLERLSPETGAYNIALAARARGLDAAALHDALSCLAARHPALRTVFLTLPSGEPVQRVLATPEIDFAAVDATAWSEGCLGARLAAEAWRPFDLARGPLLRARVFERPAGERVLLFAVHHLVADFWSLGIAARELGALLGGSLESDLPPLSRTYADFARRQAALLAGPEGERLWAYWQQALAGERGPLPDLALPTDRPRPPVATGRGLARAATLPADLAAALSGLAAAEGATLFTLLAAAWQVQLGRYCDQDDFAVGTPTSGRTAPEWAEVFGYFVNPVPLRADLAGDPPFRELLARTRRTALAALAHADYPFVLLAERLRSRRDPARTPLFQALLALEPRRPGDDPGLAGFALGAEGARIALGGGVELTSLDLAERPAQFELSLAAAELPEGGLGLSLEVAADLFDPATVERMLGHFRTLLAALPATAASPDLAVADLPLLTAAERAELARATAGRAAPVSAAPPTTLHERVLEQARRAPDALALVVGAEHLTYAGLLARAGALARLLRHREVEPERPVALLVERSADLVVGCLGILLAGGVYLPLDPHEAAARLAAVLADAGAAVLVTQADLAARLPETGVPLLLLDRPVLGVPGADPAERLAARSAHTKERSGVGAGHTTGGEREPTARPVLPEHLAYLIYTSGSTGRPKGVGVTHAAAAEDCRTWARVHGIQAGDRLLQFASAGFDAAIEQVFSTLFAGATLVLRGPDLWGPRELVERAAALAVTFLELPTAFFARWVEDAVENTELGEPPPSLRLIGVSGEELRAATVRRLARTPLARVPLHNCYGPTEAVISATLHRVRPEEGEEGPVPIGLPLPGRVARVLDRRGAPQPVGVPGELHLGGLLARGYLGRPERTAESFVPDPWGEPGERLYRTGDLARVLANGALEFLGRQDDQVKVRGFRVEPGEVAAVLAGHPAVREAAVLALAPDGAPALPISERRLVAFLAPALPADLAAFLAARLPAAMHPAAWLALPALPENVSGKVDRAALVRRAAEARLLEGREAGEAPVAPPASPTEELLAGIWAGLLGRERVGVDDDFFALGGHSLLATRVVAQVSRVFGVDLPVSAVFAAPTVAGLAARIEAAAPAAITAGAPPILPRPRRAGEPVPPVPLSFAQRRLWFLEQLQPGTAVYNIPGAVRLAGPLAVPAFAAALAEVVRRHEVLRTVFPEADGEPVGRVEPALPERAALPLVDLAGLPAASRAAEAERQSRAAARRPFDLARGPVLRTLLLRLAPAEHLLLATFHHIAADGWSLDLFLDEVAALYAANELAALSAASPLPELPVQYADFAAWQAEWLSGEVLARELAHWRERLAGLPVLELPTDRPRPAVRDVRGATRARTLPPATAAAVTRLARERGVTPFMALLALFQLLLARWTGEAAIPVGSPVANRRRPEVEPLIGLFVNTLVLAAEVGDDPALAEYLARVRQVCLDAYAHQDLPFERLVEELRPSRDLGSNPLFQVMFVLEEPLPARRAGALTLEPRRAGDTGTAKFDLLLALAPGEDGGWEALAEHAAALFEPVTIDRLLGHFEVLLAAASAAAPAARLSTLPLLSAAERQQVVGEWNDTATAFPDGERLERLERLEELVAAQAARTPDAVAVLGSSGERLTYGGLLARAQGLAVELRARGIGPESRVGLCIKRTPDLIAAILGVLAAGAAYVPLDPGYPEERLELMLTDSAAELLLTERAFAGRFGSFAGPVAFWEGSLPSLPVGRAGEGHAIDSDRNLAYIIYTSGSTGRPKGVGIEHRSAVTLVRWALQTFPRQDLEGVLAATSVCFDLSIFEIFVPLAAGGRVILAPDVTGLPQLATAAEVTLVNGVPSPLAEMVEAPLPAGLRTVNLAGEALPPELAARLYAHPQVERVVNLYGPSEDTTYSTFATVPRGASRVAIGRPLANTRARVLGPPLPGSEPLPAAVPGELFLAGDGLARGYLGRPELTAERFVPDPWGPPGARMYATGDRARLLADGQLEFLGRKDHQVKLHGFRLELGEIEAHLAAHPAVQQAVVVLRPDGPGGAQLVGYVVPQEGREEAGLPAALAAFLGRSLPAIMVPAAWVVLPELPRSPNGKVDRRALPAPARPRGTDGMPILPRTPLEERLAAIWRELLGVDRVGVHDDFFALGGHSLLAVRAAFRAGQALGIEVPVAALFQNPTVAGLAERLARALPAPVDSVPDSMRWASRESPGPFPLSFAQQRLWFLERLRPGRSGYGLGVWVRLAGDLSVPALAGSLGEIVRRHEPLRTVYGESDGQPFQTVLPAPAAPPLARVDLAGLPAGRRAAALAAIARALLDRPFDLERGPVARFLLATLGAGEHVLLSALHHIATDGWSMEVFFADLVALYGAAVTGRPAPLPALPWRYVDQVLWQRRVLSEETAGEGLLREQLAWWRDRLAGAPSLELPLDRPRPAVWAPRGASVPLALPPDLVAALSALARAEGGTLFMALLAGFFTLLARYSGQDDLSVGVPVAGRGRAETAGMVGLFVNTLVVRMGLPAAGGFRQLVGQVRETALAVQAHQDLPFERLVEELQPERTTGGSPLFQALFAFLSAASGPVALPGLTLELIEGESTTARFDLSCALHQREGRVHGWLEYPTALFTAATAARLRDHLLALLQAAAEAPDARALELPLLSAAEQQQLAMEWNEAALDSGGNADTPTVVHLLERQVAAAPDRLAVTGGGASLTYGELGRRSDRLARRLARSGFGLDDRIGLLLERSVKVAVAMLGVWKAGAAWVPLDPALPEARLSLLAADAGLAALLVDAGRRPAWGVSVLDLEESAREEEIAAPSPGPEPQGLAYLLYTSGTTGRPKAVAVEHGSLVQLLRSFLARFPLGPEDRLPYLASVSFDATLLELCAPLLAGGQVEVLTREEVLDFGRLAESLRRASRLNGVPSLLARLNEFLRERGAAEGFAGLRTIHVGGERVDPDLLRDFHATFPAAAVAAFYGPTEATIICAGWPVERGDEGERSLLGRPLPGAALEIRDRWGNLAPVGVPGELLVGGATLARGYLGRPDLTADRFRPAPGGLPGGRLYRTGDLARLLGDGRIEFLGRTDAQVKIRGVRIEPGEVEAALRAQPGVRAAAVAAPPGSGPGGELRLTAYVVPAPDRPWERLVADLRRALAARLPDSMVPSLWVALPALPLSPSGKVDRRALPAPAEEEALDALEAAAYRSPEEELLAALWAELLGRARGAPVERHDQFFDLGGHSLLLTQLASRIRRAFGVELPLSDLFAAPTLAEQARRIALARRGEVVDEPGIEPRPRQGPLPLSFAQERLWFLARLEPGPLYNMPLGALLSGPLAAPALAAALAAIVGRHEALRTRFLEERGRPVQVALPTEAIAALALPVIDLAALPRERREPLARDLAGAEARRPFDLSSGRLLRAALLRLDRGEHQILLTLHHIVADGWSMGVLLAELAELYAAATEGRPARLPALPIQYADFALWQRERLAGERLDRELAHWRERLAGAPEVLDLPTDRPRRSLPAASPARGGQRPFALPAATWAELTRFARRQGETPFMPLLAAFAALLARESGQRDMVIGSPIANRNRFEIEGLIGFFANTLALRLDLAGDPTFAELALRARAVCLDAYAHQDLPFEKLVEELHPLREAGRTPLFQVLFALQNAPLHLALPGLGVELLEGDSGTAKFDLALLLWEGRGAEGGLQGGVEHSRDLFDEATVDRFLGHLGTLLAGAAADPAARLSELPLLTPSERAELAAWANPAKPTPRPRLIHERVACEAARTPAAIAVVAAGAHLTYRELLRRAHGLALHLRALGVGPDVPVALFFERSPEAILALLSALAAGGAYLPLDPEHPGERLRRTIADAGAPVVLTQARLAGKLPAGAARVLAVDEGAGSAPLDGPLPPSPVAPEHLAYVTYTSGSTGRPKGVAMTHGAISAMLDWQLRTSALGAGRTLQFTSLAFDVSFQEIFGTWCAGGTLVLVSEEVRRDPPALARLLAEAEVERLFLPFVALQQLAVAVSSKRAPLTPAGPGFPSALREVMSAGEQLYVTREVAALFARLPGSALHNHYGPSETHAATWLPLTGDPAGWPERPSIGRPLDHARVLLLDRLDPHGEPVPVGVPGEVWVGGAGLARGYFGQPERTAERFLPDPFADLPGWRPGARLYRTGDLARRTPAGVAEFLGRADFQVKVRGQRIELPEIETALARHPAVLQAAVATHGASAAARRLVGYVAFRPETPVPTPAELRAFLAESLPDPMVPTAWVRLERLPLTATGKLDRRALDQLPPSEPWGGGDQGGFVAPRNPAEELLAGIWREVLGVPRVGAHDGFFDLGGHSLLATQVASRVREAFSVELPLRRVFEAPTLAELAAAIAEERAGGEAPAAPPLRPAPRTGDLPLSFAQERLWFLDRLQPGGAAYNVPLFLRARGRLDLPRLQAALAGLVRRHEALRTVFAERGGAPVQVVLPAPETPSAVPLPVADLGSLPPAAREAEARRLARAEAARPFDLARGPLLRALFLDLGPEAGLLSLALHHIVADGWSLGVLVREVKALYAGEGERLPALPVQYADFALWQRGWLSGENLARQIAWWRERLAGAPGALELPADHLRPPVQSQRGAEHRFALEAALAGPLAALAGRIGATPFMVLAAGLFTLLARLSGQRDVVLGSPIANRTRREIEGLIGFFVNTLALRADLSRAATFGELLRQVREASLGAYAHQEVPFEKLVDELQPDRDLSRSPLFQVAFALQNTVLPAQRPPAEEIALGGVRLVPEELPAEVAKFDLSFVLAEDEGGRLAGLLQYATDLFEATTAARLARGFAVLLGNLIADPEAPLAAAPLLAAAERQQLLREWNDTGAPLPAGTLHGRFAERVEDQPDAVAVVWEGMHLTYGGLAARARRLAHFLSDLGVGPGTPVGVWLERSPHMVAAVLAVLQAGGHYLPLDLGWPSERAEAVLAGARAPVLLTSAARLAAARELQWRLELADVVCLDIATPEPPAEAVDAAEVRALWDFVAENAGDRETDGAADWAGNRAADWAGDGAADWAALGGFISSYTGQPFSAAEVDEYRDRVLALAAPWLSPAARVLEIGCGAGLLLWEMAPRVARMVGIDPSPATQERNRRWAEERGLGNVELPTGFAHEIDEKVAGEFDLIVLASTVQFFPGPIYLERVVERALRRLAPGGALLIADVPDARRREELRRSLAEAGAPGRPEGGQGRETWWDQGQFRAFGALPEVGEVSIRERQEGFANELRFRYDVLLTRAAGDRPASSPPLKRLWTGWHVARRSAERLGTAVSPDDLAYVIHTSGSTGAPKGIGVQHRPAVHLVDWVNATFGIGPGDRLLFVTALGFDLSVYDLFGTLAAGGTIEVAPEAALADPERLARLLVEAPVTIWDSAPAALQQLAPRFPEAPRPGSALRLALLSGDWIPVGLPDQVRAAFPGTRVISLGGATEATVWSNWFPIGEVDPLWPSIPYGRPIGNARYHVVDEAWNPCPIGVPGDLYIGGEVLSLGYIYEPERTAQSFLPDPFAAIPGSRLYRTGDRARYGADGNLEFLGRVDHQVKVRGYRIELGEIEVALTRHTGVRQAVVLAREDVPGEKRLVAYVVPKASRAPSTLEGQELRAFLLASLPEYMVPWAFVSLAELPVTANGKLDREALPAPRDAQAAALAYVAPRNDLERAVAAVWREVLGVERIGVQESFFTVGGSSLLLARLQARLRQELGREISFVELFQHPTIEAQARSLAGAAPPPKERTERVRARTESRRESMREVRERARQRRGGPRGT
jgi:amino acid adenylation domain-containing protein